MTSTAEHYSEKRWELVSQPSPTQDPRILETSLPKPSYTKLLAKQHQYLWGSTSKDWILDCFPNFLSVRLAALLLTCTERKFDDFLHVEFCNLYMFNFVIYTCPILWFLQVQFCHIYKSNSVNKYMVIGGFKPNRGCIHVLRASAPSMLLLLSCVSVPARDVNLRDTISASCVFERKRYMKRN